MEDDTTFVFFYDTIPLTHAILHPSIRFKPRPWLVCTVIIIYLFEEDDMMKSL